MVNKKQQKVKKKQRDESVEERRELWYDVAEAWENANDALQTVLLMVRDGKRYDALVISVQDAQAALRSYELHVDRVLQRIITQDEIDAL